MPNCLKCGTWNPEDKNVCWRCQTELPKPVIKKKRGPVRVLGLSIWIWLAIVLFRRHDDCHAVYRQGRRGLGALGWLDL